MRARGENALTLPAQIEAGLAANDRLKYYFTLLQVARSHADQPDQPAPSLKQERLVAGISNSAFDQLVSGTRKEGLSYCLSGCRHILAAIARLAYHGRSSRSFDQAAPKELAR